MEPGCTTSVAPLDASALLLTLEEISRLISHSHRPEQTLDNIVRLIQGRFATDVCSVYLLEPEVEGMVLGATVGLRPESVGRIRMRQGEGLTGLVAEQMAPVMVEDAFRHPRFKYFPEAGEDPYHSFLGVPLIEGGALQGILVVQTEERRCFSPDEVRLLVAVAAQLAPLVGEARLLDRLLAAAHGAEQPSVGLVAEEPTGPWQGVPLSPGIGQGEAYLIEWSHEQAVPTPEPRSHAEEVRRLDTALRAASEELDRQSRHVAELIGEDLGGILQGQLMILQDEAIRKDLQSALVPGVTAEQAVNQVLAKYATAFQKLASPYFRERVYDLKDVFRRIAWHLRPRPDNPAGVRLVLVAPEPSVMDLFAVDLQYLAGIVVEQGGAQCHAAILARSLGIPMVGQVEVGRLTSGRIILVDGNAGKVFPDPPPGPFVLPAPPAPLGARRKDIADPPPAPIPRWAPRLEANINLLSEASKAVANGAEGVGLFRSEVVFAARRSFPTEEEQVRIYRKLVASLNGRSVTIRTFDVRGEHSAAAMSGGMRSGPLDWRLVLQSPPLQQVFKEQVRAILRTAGSGSVRMLVPLVVRSELIDLVAETIERAGEELEREGIEFGRQVPLGVMIELAAAVPLVESWAEQVDFFALGTNDLAASSLGLDRDHPVGNSREDVLHPGLFRLIRDVAESCHRTGKPLTVCGELAATPEGTLALASLRVDALSVAVDQLPLVRRCLQNLPPTDLPTQLNGARTAKQVTQILRQLLPREAAE